MNLRQWVIHPLVWGIASAVFFLALNRGGAAATVLAESSAALAASPASEGSTDPVLPLGINFPVAPNAGPGAVMGKPSIAFDGTNFFLVWRDSRDFATHSYDIYGARIALDGTVLDPDGIPISTFANHDENPGNQYSPSVGFDGTNYMVVWVESRDDPAYWYNVYAARVTPGGTVLDPEGIQITNVDDGSYLPVRMPTIGFDGTNYLVVWRTVSNNIRGARLTPQGVNLDGPYGLIISGTQSSYYPYLAFDGTNYLVVWHDSRSSTTGWDVYGARISKQGVVLDPNGFLIADEPGNQDHVAVAFGGTNYLVVWFDYRPNLDVYDGRAYAARVTPDGVVLDDPAFQVAEHVIGQDTPRLVFDGTDYFVAWVSYGAVARDRWADSYGLRISTAGKLLDNRPIPIGVASGHQWRPHIGYANGRYLVVWNEGGGRCEWCVWGEMMQRQPATYPDPPPPAPSSPSCTGWSTQSGATADILDLWGVGAENAYAEGAKGEVFHYKGENWTEDYHIEWDIRQHGIWGSGPDNIWSTGLCWAFYHFDGSAWTRQNCSPVGQGMAIWGSGEKPVMAVGSRGTAFKFNGISWDSLVTGISTDMWDVWGSSANDIYAVGEFGRVFHYDGSAWSAVPGIPSPQALNGIWGSRANDIFIVGDFGTILHFDGSAWSLQESGTRQHLFGVWGISDRDVYAAGFDGTIVYYDGNAWQVECSGAPQDLYTVSGVKTWQKARLDVWAAGQGGVVLHKTVPLPLSRSYLPLMPH